MPKRTNPKQQVIEMLKALLAPDGCTVTPSKFLVDTQLNIQREVDIVVETEIDGHVFIQSLEVVGRGRPMDLGWVEGMLRKHLTLPTDRLFLVSWSGFTADALRLARATPRTFPVTLAKVQGSTTLYADQVNLTVKRVAPRVRLPDGRVVPVRGPLDLAVFAQDGAAQGTLGQLGTWLVQRPALGQAALESAHSHPRRGEMRWF